jgi:hypothetical protein
VIVSHSDLPPELHAPVPPACDGIRAENERWANAVNRFHVQKQAGDRQEGGFEVPPLPSSATPSP